MTRTDHEPTDESGLEKERESELPVTEYVRLRTRRAPVPDPVSVVELWCGECARVGRVGSAESRF